MLKIKDEVNLKDLESFGFIYRANLLYKPSYKDKDLVDIMINQDTREVNCSGLLGRSEKLDSLYDLIKADLVEKIIEGEDKE